MKRCLSILTAAVVGVVVAVVPAATVSAAPPPGSELWLRAGDGYTFADGKVAAWADQSGHGRHATMPVAERRPGYQQVTIGTHWVRFSGAQSLGLAAPVNPARYTIFVAGRSTNPIDASHGVILGPGGSDPNNQVRWEGPSQLMLVRTLPQGVSIATSDIGNNRVTHVLAITYDGGVQRVHRNGTLKSTRLLGTSLTPFVMSSVGSYYSTTFLTGDIGEIIVYPWAMSDLDRMAAEKYLKGKFHIL